MTAPSAPDPATPQRCVGCVGDDEIDPGCPVHGNPSNPRYATTLGRRYTEISDDPTTALAPQAAAVVNEMADAIVAEFDGPDADAAFVVSARAIAEVAWEAAAPHVARQFADLTAKVKLLAAGDPDMRTVMAYELGLEEGAAERDALQRQVADLTKQRDAATREADHWAEKWTDISTRYAELGTAENEAGYQSGRRDGFVELEKLQQQVADAKALCDAAVDHYYGPNARVGWDLDPGAVRAALDRPADD